MRKSLTIGIGVATAALLVAAGLATANAATSTDVQSDDKQQSAPATPVDRAGAERIALATVPGGMVVETRYEADHGKAEWNVHLSTAKGMVEVKVDAQTGATYVDDRDDDADDRDDDRDDDSGHHDGDHDQHGDNSGHH